MSLRIRKEITYNHAKIGMSKQISIRGSESLRGGEVAGVSVTLSVQRSKELRRIYKTVAAKKPVRKLILSKVWNRYSQAESKWFYLCLKFNFLANNSHAALLVLKDRHYVIQAYLGKSFCDDWQSLTNIVVKQESFKPNWEKTLYELISDPRGFSEEKILLLLFLKDSSEEQMVIFKDLPVPYLYKVLS